MSVATVLSLFSSFFAGSRLLDGGQALQLASLRHSTTAGIIAHSGGGQTSATALLAANNEVETVAAPADSVMLPLAIPGMIVRVYNATANSMQVFGQVSNPQNANAGDTIIPNNSNSPAATGTGVAQANTVDAVYTCYKVGVWKQHITA